MKGPYKTVSCDDTTESDLSSKTAKEDEEEDEDEEKEEYEEEWEEDQDTSPSNPALGHLFARLPAEVKIEIWSEILLVDERPIQYEVIFRLPQRGGASVRPLIPEDQDKVRRKRVREIAVLTYESYTAVRGTYVSLPRHSGQGYPANNRWLCSRYSTLACPKIDRFTWVMSDDEVLLSRAPVRWPGLTYPPIQDFLRCLSMPDFQDHPMYGWAGDMRLYRRFGEQSLLIFNTIHHLELPLPALSGQIVHDMEEGLRAFRNLWTVTMSTRVPKPGRTWGSNSCVLGPIAHHAWRRYVAQNDAMVKAILSVELRQRWAGLGPVIPADWCRISVRDFGVSFLRIHVWSAVIEAEDLYEMGEMEWRHFFKLYDMLVRRNVEVSIVSGHHTDWMVLSRW